MHAMIGRSYKLLRSFGMSTLQPLLGAIVEEITHFYLKRSTAIYIHEGKWMQKNLVDNVSNDPLKQRPICAFS